MCWFQKGDFLNVGEERTTLSLGNISFAKKENDHER
jgi:hypothetical protein